MILLPATACGLLSVAVLNVNNMRDIENDIKSGKNTLAVRLGTKGARKYHTGLILIAIFCLILFSLLYLRHWTGWLFLLAIPMLLNHIKRVIHDTSALGMKPLLENIIKAALLTNILFSVRLILN